MKQIANFTQTYKGTFKWSPGSDGRNRDFLIDAMLHNEGKLKTLNLLDLQTFSFHNMDKNHCESLAKKIKHKLPKCEFLVYQEMSLGSTFLKHLSFLKEKGITDFLWLQDDEFFTHNNFEDFKLVLDFYKNNSEVKHVNLLHRINNGVQQDAYSVHKGISNVEKIQLTKNIFLNKTHTKDIVKANNYAMDFTCFLCDIDYFLTNMFDESFVEFLDAYKLEGAVNERSIQNNVQRYIPNISFFESFNIVGMPPSLGKSEEALTKLRKLVSST